MEKIKNILVTGGAGFIGSNLVDRLIKEGHTVIVVDNFSTGKRENINSNAKVYELNVEDEDLKKVFRRDNIDIVYHLASPSNVKKSMEDQISELSKSVEGMVNLIKCVSEFGVKKVILASTLQVYGENVGVINEKMCIRPVTYNGLVHSMNENILKVAAKSYGFKYSILRYSNVYGMRQSDLGEGGLIQKYINVLSNGSVPVIVGDNDIPRDYIFISDVVNANISVLTSGDNEAYNIAAGEGKSLENIVGIIIKKMNSEVKCMVENGKIVYSFYSDVNIEKAIKELSWRPVCSLEIGIGITCKENRK